MQVDNTEREIPYLLKKNANCKYLHFLIFMSEFIPEKGILFGKTVDFSEGRPKPSWKGEGVRTKRVTTAFVFGLRGSQVPS